MNKKIVYFDLDNVLVDFMSGVNRIPKEVVEEYDGRLDEIPNVFGLMEPMKGAIEAFNVISEKYDAYILSTSPWENPSAWSDKPKWVKKYLGEHAYKRLILTHHKELNKGDYLIDDRTNKGAGDFEGELILFGFEKYPDWSAIIEYLINSININERRTQTST